MYYVALFIDFCSALLGGLIFVIIRSLKEVHFTIINGFYGFCLTIVSSLILFAFRWSHISSYDFDTKQYLIMISIGVLSNFANQCTIVACSLDKASRIATLNFLQVFFSYLFDVLLFGYTLGFLEFVGAAIIIACSSVAVVIKYLNQYD